MMLFDTHFAPAPVATQGVHNQGPDVCLDIATVGEDRKKEEKKTKKLFGKATDWKAENRTCSSPRAVQ